MSLINIDKDIEVIYLEVPNFPLDVPGTYERLHKIIPDRRDRKYFGISHPDQSGIIVYKAAAELLPEDDIAQLGLKTFTIKKGTFASEYIVNHFQDSQCIGQAFERLLKHPALDQEGYCLEWYRNYTDLDVQCMVRINF